MILFNKKFLSKQQVINLLRENYHILILFLIMLISLFFNLFNISQYGYGNEYYAAAIKSMSENFKNFFFVSFDPAGMLSIDKPPLGFWIQTLSVLILGYSGLALLLPQALASTASCFMMYVLVSKHFGKISGLISAFVFSITPAVVVASRNNTVDMQLVFVLLLSIYFLFKSIEKESPKYLYIAGILIGLGFNIKMLQAYMYLPAICITYLIFAKGKFMKKLLDGVISCVIMLCISFSWAIFVDLYPSENRPYVGSSDSNSVMELIIDHNGLERIYGSSNKANPQNSNDKNIGPTNDGTHSKSNSHASNDKPKNPSSSNANINRNTNKINPQNNNTPPNSLGKTSSNKNSSGGRDSISDPSPFRLWSNELYGQVSWLIIFCIFAIISCIKKFSKKDLSIENSVLAFWTLNFFTMFIFFSFAGYFHRYYLCMFAPSISALFGIEFVKMFKDFKSTDCLKSSLLILAFFCTSTVQLKYIDDYPKLTESLFFVCLGLSLLTLITIFINYIKSNKYLMLCEGLFLISALIICPLYWATTPVKYVPSNFVKPYAGPELASDNSNNKSHSSSNTSLQDYLVKNYKEGSFLVVSRSTSDVDSFIINTGLPAYAYGGFSGSDNSLTLDKLKEYVSEGKITYFLVSNKGNDSDIIDYVKENATLIDPSEYGSNSSNNSLYLFE